MDIQNMDLSNMIPAGFYGSVVTGLTIGMWGIILIGIVYIVICWLRYRIPVELYSKEGNTIICIGTTRAKENITGQGNEYELRKSMFLSKRKKEYFRIDDAKFKLPSRKGIMFKLVKTGFNDYHPIAFAEKEVVFEIIPQSNISWLVNKFRAIHEKYTKPSIFNHPLFMPMVFIVVAVIELIIIIMVLDKVGQVGGACQAAKENILGAITQKLS